MKVPVRALRLSIFLRDDDIWHHKPVYAEIVHRAHKAGLAGATVIRGVEGYGHAAKIHTTHMFGSGVPVLIVIADAEQRIRDFLPQLDELGVSGLCVLDEVEAVVYRKAVRSR
ncbi:DUF190 domain-containing protein [Fodinicola acaciae]|uniref:DUF190 domain-containing protein n=1 Tax=Fodinicola acaciae TaxID=2681555 RepID=UPI0013D48C58|nr:DUF190 domain-containing protein [Fodinicola acaciae]